VGKPIAPMIAASILTFALAMTSILTFDIFWVLVCFASPCFAISNASVSTMYSFGRQCQRKLACAGQGGFVSSNHVQMRTSSTHLSPRFGFLIADIRSRNKLLADALE
tara:strand:+ start:242 stop:565 length:324 start_codon:yes stop_codon:yes gene_type:complete